MSAPELSVQHSGAAPPHPGRARDQRADQLAIDLATADSARRSVVLARRGVTGACTALDLALADGRPVVELVRRNAELLAAYDRLDAATAEWKVAAHRAFVTATS